jgi:tetratricopeptide (TPR) repeat protein
LPFIPRAAEIDQEKDRRLASCAKILAECTSVHAVATWLMQTQPWDFTAVYYDAIDHFCHGFMRYHPPRQDHVSEEDFELYRGVIEAGYRYHDMMLNTLIELAGPETTVILMSDHGFHPDHLRPKSLPAEPAGPAHEHRDFGIFVIHGPDIKPDTLLHGLNLLDITPTLLTLFGLPVGDDMDGQPAVEAFVDPPDVPSIPSWDDVPGDAGRHPDDMQLDTVAAQEAVQQLVDLGYIEPPGPDRELAIERTVRELRYNLARAYMDDNRHGAAAEILEELYARWPNEHRFGVQLALCFQALDRIADLRSVVDDLGTRRKADAEQARVELKEFVKQIRQRRANEAGDRRPEAGDRSPEAGGKTLPKGETEQSTPASGLQPPASLRLSDAERHRYRDLRGRAHYNPFAIDYLWGYVALAEGDYERALDYLLRSENVDAQRPGLHLQVGEAYLKLRRADDAERSFSQAVRVDPENPHAHLGLSRVHLLRRKNRQAAESALRTIGLLYQYPMAHYCLGVALHRMGRVMQAVEALQVAVSLNPNFAEAHGRLATIYGKRLGDRETAGQHRELARDMRLARRRALAAKRKYQSPEERGQQEAGDRRLETGGGSGATGEGKSDAVDVLQPPASSLQPSVPPDPEKFVTVVSGLPRSGTSLVMQMLEAAGLDVLTDGRRVADENNPRGYLELEQVKNLRADNAWLGEAQGKVVKIIAQLLPYLPRPYRYKIVFVDRDLDEILASQRAMLHRDGRDGAKLSDDQLRRVFATQSSRMQRWIASQPNIDSLVVNHRALVTDPAEPAAAINALFNNALDIQRMTAVVDPSLYRQRK